jgi:hypothetical protein
LSNRPLTEYLKGKTLDEVLAVGVDDASTCHRRRADRLVTIKIDGYLAAVAKAVQNAQPIGAKAGDKLAWASPPTCTCPRPRRPDAEGSAQSLLVRDPPSPYDAQALSPVAS